MPNKVEQLLADLDTKLFLEGAPSRPSSRRWLPIAWPLPAQHRQFAGCSYEADPARCAPRSNNFFVSKEGPEVKA